MDGTIRRQLAFIQAEIVNGELVGSQEGIAGKELLQAVQWRVIQSRQGEVWRVFLFLPWNSDCREFLVNGPPQGKQRVGRLHSGPENLWHAAWWKNADSMQAEGKWPMRDFGQYLFYIEELATFYLPYKFQGKMHLLKWNRSSSGNKPAESGNFAANSFWNAKRYE